MNIQNFMERMNDSPNVEKTDQDSNRPVVNSDSYAKVSMDETVADVGPLDETIVQEAPMGQTIIYNKDSMGETLVQEAPNGSNADSATTLLSPEEAELFRARWNEIQGQFVDEPRSAVKQADALVCEVVEKIAQLFANEQSSLEDQWKQGNEVSTEDLRQTLQHYRTFFNRLTMQIPV